MKIKLIFSLLAATILSAFTQEIQGQASKPDKLLAARLIESTIRQSGMGDAKAQFEKIKTDTLHYIIKESQFNAAGYRLMNSGMLDEALEIFKMNVELFPKSTNVYDSQGEACLYLRDKEKAIASYKKIRELDPANLSGETIIKNINIELNNRLLSISNLFFEAAKNGDINTVKSWLKRDPTLLNSLSTDGNSALHLAVYGGHKELVDYLVSHKAELNLRNLLGQTPFNLAENGNLDSIGNILVSKGARQSPQEFPDLRGKYLGKKEPGLKPEVFAPRIVSTHTGVYSAIVFSPDLAEACWTPNDGNTIQNKGGFITTRIKNGKWTAPTYQGYLSAEYSHNSPFYSLDGKRLFFQGNLAGQPAMDMFEKFFYVEKNAEGWSKPKLLDSIFNKYSVHWQFSVDKNQNLYFGGALRGKDQTGGIYYAPFVNGNYLEPRLIFSDEKLRDYVFGPAISPDGDFLVFTRVLPRGLASPRIFSIHVSFRTDENEWTEPQDLGEKLEMDSNQPRISPDGKFLFFVSNDRLAYWVDAKIIEEFRPKK